MSSSKKLSDDVDLIKEFESLKLKQSLLLESLKHKHKQEENDKKIKEVHSIVQQLLDVFLEAKEGKKSDSSESDDEEETKKEDPLVRIENKIDALQKDVSQLQQKIEKPNKEFNSKERLGNEISEKLNSFEDNENMKKNSNSNSNEKIPPIPKTWGNEDNQGDNKL